MSVFNELQSEGLLQALYNHDEISAIFINAQDKIYVKQNGTLQKINSRFKDSEEMWAAIDDFLKPFGHTINPDLTLWQTRLPDGAWINLLSPPAVINGPTLTIRKSMKDMLTMQDLIRFSCLSSEAADFLKACVKARLNILVSGGPSSGKTTTLNILASFITDEAERIITIEQTSELTLRQKHVVTLIGDAGITAGKEKLSKADLVCNSFHMMADRIIVVEVDGDEVVPLLQTAPGFEGIMASIFAMNPHEAVTRLELLMMEADPSIAVTTRRELIATGFDVVVQLNRLKDGSRKVMKITEVTGMQGETIILSDIFKYQETGIVDNKICGRTITTGVKPGFLGRLEAAGFPYPPGLFDSIHDEV